jgi:hypothetical protein
MVFGNWQPEEHVEVDNEGAVVELNWKFEPAEPVESSQGFEIVGPLSSLYAALYNLRTLDEAGRVKSLLARPEPDVLVGLIPDDYWDNADRALPLWRLNVQPRQSPDVN